MESVSRVARWVPALTRASRRRNPSLMNRAFVSKRAVALWSEATDELLRGRVAHAIRLYTRSIEMYPTAEAHTFRGWAYSIRKDFDHAIRECKIAIDLDPGFGNPYNDIGSYLVAMWRIDEAIAWLIKAKSAPRYEARHFPFMNLGRIYTAKGMIRQAIAEFEGALELRPDESSCIASIEKLRSLLH